MRVRRLAPLIAGGAVVLVALLAAYAGPVQVGDPVIPFDRWELTMPELDEQEDMDLLDGEESEYTANPFTIGVLVFGLVAAAVGLAVVVLALIQLVRALRQLRWSPPVKESDDYDIRIEAVLAAAVEEATREAEGVAPGMATDAVIACWIRLEQAAAEVDTPRSAHQTPSEFTAALLTEQHADAGAVTALLTLYHRARFSAQPLPDEAATQAAQALHRIAGTMRARRQAEEPAP